MANIVPLFTKVNSNSISRQMLALFRTKKYSELAMILVWSNADHGP
jgi:hypothetical protein